MDATHLHLILTHFPIVGSFIGVGVLGYGLFSKNLMVKKVGLAIFIFSALLTIPVYLTGEEAEETVEHIPGITEGAIHNHEEFAEKAILLMGLLGALSLLTLYAFWKKLNIAKTATIITFIVGLLTFGAFAKVGSLGGQIRHTEITDGFVPPVAEGHHDNDED